VQVIGSNDWSTRSVVLTVANGLRDRSMRGSPEFTVGRAPAGFTLVEFHPEGITIGPRGSGPDSREAVTVAVRRPSSQTDGHGRSVVVGKLAGWLLTDHGRYDLVLKLSSAARLEITTPAGGPWTEPQLRHFVAGITYSGPPPRAEG